MAMNSKKLSSRANAYLGILTLVVILAVVGLTSEMFFHRRLDLTSGKQFTLSKASLNTIRSLPDLVTVKVVMSKDLPTQFLQIRTHVVDLLREFEAQANGKITLVFEDPGESETKRQSATSLGIQEVQLQEQSSEGLQIKKGFFGLAMTYGDKKEVIPVLQNLESFEYDLVVKLKKLTGSIKTIGILEGGQGAKLSMTLPGPQPKTTSGFDENFPTLKEEAEKLYKLEKLDPLTGPIPETVDLLLVAAPSHITEQEKFRIDQFLMKGKSVMFLAPGVDMSLGMGINGTASHNGYEDLLAHYGLAVKKNVVLEDRNYQFVRFGNSFFPSPYPYWIIVQGDGLNSDSPITSKLGAVSLPWASSVEIDTSRKDSTKVEILAQSTPGSWEEANNFFLLPRDMKEYLPVKQHTQNLVVLKSGKFHSFYENRPAPAGDSTQKPDTAGVLRVSQKESRILVVGNALFATDFYVGYTNAVANLHLVLNSFDQLALDPDLITIRSREIANSPILEAKKTKKPYILLLNMVVAPLLLLGAGVVIGIRRKKKEAMA
ncbi:MAG: gliding motility protein GldG [Fibrobacteres bacterium]|nr:gliding motility protein GldG [Fibrobacterota bacterium]